LIVAGGAILGAALLLPVGQFALRSTRTQAASLEFSNSYAMPGGQLITLLIPNFFCQPRLEYGYWGLPFYEEVTGYVGILPLVALLLALSLRQRKAAALLAIFAALGLVVSLGIDGGLFPTLYRLLPGYSLFRVPSRALYFTVIGAAGLAALLVTELQVSTSEERARLLRPALRWMLPAALIIAMLVSLALAAYFTIHSADETPPWRTFYSGSMAGLAIVSILLTWAVLRAWVSGNNRWIPGFVVLVVVFDLWHVSQLMVTVSAIDVPPLWQTVAQTVPASPDYRVMTVPYNVSWQAGAVYTRHLNANGYDPLVSSATQRLLDASQQNPTLPIARLLGVRYAISDKPYEWSKLSGIDELSLIIQSGDWKIYQTRDPLPHAFVAPNSTVLQDEPAIQQLMSGNLDPGSVAIIDHPINCPSGGSLSAANITRYEPNTVEISTNQAGILILSDSYDPAWTVTVDGASAELLRAYTALRGVCVPAGLHSVRFEYHPAAFTLGLVISGVGWLAWAIAAGIVVLEAKRKTKRDQ
jgi:hypothetical protein